MRTSMDVTKLNMLFLGLGHRHKEHETLRHANQGTTTNQLQSFPWT